MAGDTGSGFGSCQRRSDLMIPSSVFGWLRAWRAGAENHTLGQANLAFGDMP